MRLKLYLYDEVTDAVTSDIMFSNISQQRQKLILKISVILNLCLLLYLSLFAGWNASSSSFGGHFFKPQTGPYNRAILNRYFGKKFLQKEIDLTERKLKVKC